MLHLSLLRVRDLRLCERCHDLSLEGDPLRRYDRDLEADLEVEVAEEEDREELLRLECLLVCLPLPLGEMERRLLQ